MEVFVARQPIFDRNQKVFGYELLYRIGYDNFYDNSDGDRATSEVIANSFLSIGIEALTGNKRAFINFTENLLKSELPSILPKELVAIEILEDVKGNAEIVAACSKLKGQGYTLVLDDFVFSSISEPLIELADIIKVDFLTTPVQERRNMVKRLGPKSIKLLAEKVETRAEFEQAVEMGYTYFQGYFFSKPVIMSSRDVPLQKINYLQIIQEVNRPDTNFERLDAIIKRDLSLSYKLLKYINSAAFGFRSKISSIKHALVMMGLGEIKKWTMLMALRCMAEDKPDEIITSSVIRARFGELLAPKLGFANKSSDIFLMGMFSMIDALIGRPMSAVVAELALSDEVKNPLLGRESSYRDVYGLILSYEKGDWKQFSNYAAGFNLNEAEVPVLYLRSLEWASYLTKS